MYLYAFSSLAWQDGVFLAQTLNPKFKPWDLIKNDEGYFLVLGSEISFPELYQNLYQDTADFILVEKSLLSNWYLEFLHRMVYQRYSSYKVVFKLFLDKDPLALLQKKPSKVSQKKQKSEVALGKHQISTDGTQILIVAPDLRTLNNSLLSSQNALFLTNQDSQAKKNTNRRSIKSWKSQIILTTSSEIFQDFSWLSHIYLLEPQKRYYASQQEPRYKVQSVLQKIADLNWASFVIVDSEDLVG